MSKYTFEKDGKLYHRISKTQAKKQYLAGNYIIVCPVNLRPDSAWKPFMVLGDFVGSFEDAVNSCTYYNCVNSETGHYLAYFVAQDMLPSVREYADYLQDGKENIYYE